MDWMAKKLDQVSRGLPYPSGDDIFRLLVELLNRCKLWAEVMLARVNVARPSDSDRCSSGINDIPDVDQITWMQSMDLENDKWLEEVLHWSPNAL
jgi:hypothetical protein